MGNNVLKHFNNGQWSVCRARKGHCPMEGPDGKEPIHSNDPKEQEKVSKEWFEKHYGSVSSLSSTKTPIDPGAFDDMSDDERYELIDDFMYTSSDFLYAGASYEKGDNGIWTISVELDSLELDSLDDDGYEVSEEMVKDITEKVKRGLEEKSKEYGTLDNVTWDVSFTS